MITSASSEQIVAAVRLELRTAVRPALPADLLPTLEVIDQMLGVVERRSGHEVAWMRDEIDQISSLAAALLDEGHAGPPVADALSDLRAAHTSSDHLAEVQREYHRASEVLSRMAELSVSGPADTRDRVLALLRARAGREVEILGEFSLAMRG